MTENRTKHSYSQISDRCEPGVSCPQTQATVFHIKQQITWREVRGESAHCVQLSTDVDTESFQDLCSLENTRRVHVTVSDKQEDVMNKYESFSFQNVTLLSAVTTDRLNYEPAGRTELNPEPIHHTNSLNLPQTLVSAH